MREVLSSVCVERHILSSAVAPRYTCNMQSVAFSRVAALRGLGKLYNLKIRTTRELKKMLDEHFSRYNLAVLALASKDHFGKNIIKILT